MLDEQLDQEMHSSYQHIARFGTIADQWIHVVDAMRHLPTSDEDKYTNKVRVL